MLSIFKIREKAEEYVFSIPSMTSSHQKASKFFISSKTSKLFISSKNIKMLHLTTFHFPSKKKAMVWWGSTVVTYMSSDDFSFFTRKKQSETCQKQL
jgi:hypothetical protein